MKVYLVTSPAHDPKVVFAVSDPHAAEITVVWQLLSGIGACDFAVDSHWVRKLRGDDLTQMREALAWNVAGIGHLRHEGTPGWTILSPEEAVPRK